MTVKLTDLLPEIYQDVPWIKAYIESAEEIVYDQVRELCNKIIELRSPDKAESEFLGSLMRLLGFFVPFAHINEMDRRRLIADLPFFYETSGTSYFIKFLSYNIGAKVEIFNLYSNRTAINLPLIISSGSASFNNLAGPAPFSPGLSSVPEGTYNSENDVISKGMLGDLVFYANQNSSGNTLNGSIRITGTSFRHVDGSARNISSPLQLNTQYFSLDGRIGKFYLMWTDTLPNTRFVAGGANWWIDNNGSNINIIPVYFKESTSTWVAIPGSIPAVGLPFQEEEFTPLITDMIIGKGDRIGISSAGITNIIPILSFNSISTSSEVFTDSGEYYDLLVQNFNTNIINWNDATTGANNSTGFDFDSRKLKLTLLDNTSGNHPEIRYSFSTIVGAAYVVETYIAEGTSLRLNVGTSAGGTQYGSVDRVVQAHYARILFTATSATAHVSILIPASATVDRSTYVEQIRISRAGRLFSNQGGEGVFDYISGYYNLTFNTAPVTGTLVNISGITRIYQNLVPLSEIPIGQDLVENGGSWYLTNLVGVDYDILKFPNLKALADIFYRIAPAPLVLFTIQTGIVDSTEVNVASELFDIEVILSSNSGQSYIIPTSGRIGAIDESYIDQVAINASE